MNSLLQGPKMMFLFFFGYSHTDAVPSRKAMLLQIYVAMKAMPWYCALPTFSEYMVENGWTKCFSRISDVGWLGYLVYLTIYLVFVEFGIYWMHRELHDIKFLYKHLHATHHIYNKQNTLSPFAGMFLIFLLWFRWLMLFLLKLERILFFFWIWLIGSVVTGIYSKL